MASKYKNKKVVTPEGNFDSMKEYRRFKELQLLEKAGKITGLQRQVKYNLIPTQYKETFTKTGKVKRLVAEREVNYIADFVYIEDGKTVVEDIKGAKIGGAYQVFTIKRKLMRWVRGIDVKEV